MTPLLQTAAWRRRWLGDVVSQLGTQVTLLALPLTAITALGATAFQVSLLLAASHVPALLFSLPAGVWVDRTSTRRVLLIADVGRAVTLALVPLTASFGLLRLEVLYAVALINGTFTAFAEVAYPAFIASSLDSEHHPDANRLAAMSQTIGQVGGKPLGGLLVELLTAPIAIAADSLTFLLSALAFLLVKLPERERAPRGRTNLRAELAEGLRAVIGNPVLRWLALFCTCTNIFSFAAYACRLLFFTREVGLDAVGIGLIGAAGGLGGVTGAACAAALGRRLGMWGTFVLGGALIVLGQAPVPYAQGSALGALGLLSGSTAVWGFGFLLASCAGATLQMSATPWELQGRVSAIMRCIVWGIIPAGSLIGGWLGTVVGLRDTLLIGVVGQAGVLMLFLLRLPRRTTALAPAPAHSEGG